jgi:ABC-type microcin C transport system permease subunit YejE
VFYGVIWGVRTAFKTGMIVVVSTFLIGIVIGSVSAYYGGMVDNILMRIVDRSRLGGWGTRVLFAAISSPPKSAIM